jgi:glycosyltransferase involved in cell wall biosynthesis
VRNPVSESLLSAEPTYGGERAVAFVGRLVYEKGANLLPELASLLPHVQFHVMGAGPLGDFLRKSSEKHPNLIFHGFVSSEEKASIISTTSAVIMPISYTETFGYTVAEAFILGKPVVGFSLGGVKELIEDSGAGFAVPPYDLGEFSDRIGNIVDNPGLSAEMGKKGRKFVEENLSPERYALTLREIYSKVAG